MVAYKIEQSRPDGKIYIATHGMQVEVSIDAQGVIVDIVRGNEILATCQAAKAQ